MTSEQSGGGRAEDEPDARFLESLRDSRLTRAIALAKRIAGPKPTYWHTRFVLLRLLGLVYSVAFLSLYNQLTPLLGSGGLLPIRRFLPAVAARFGSTSAAALKLPTLFWLSSSDGVLIACAAAGSLLSLALLCGVTNAVVQIALWALYLSFVQVGQIFYGYGWETLLLETGFLSIFLCPLASVRPYPAAHRPPVAVIWLLRWLVLRVMLGAGLIKLRGDACWRDLTCLIYHYETQPNPHPLSYWIHRLPAWAHKAGALYNHIVELVAPFLAFGPRPARHAAGALFAAFQLILIASGNLSFLNWLTLTIGIACFDDSLLERALPRALRELAGAAERASPKTPTRAARGVVYALVVVVAFLSVGPASNMLSPRQAMNASFEPLHLVNTYGAFGSVGRERYEIVIEGTRAGAPSDDAEWLEYQFPCKPGDVRRRPCFITPYHYRLDWQMWFAAMSTIERQPWLVHLVYKLLQADPGVRGLLAVDPFGDAPPKFIRAELYKYAFTDPNDAAADPAAWWVRQPVGVYLQPVSLDDPRLLEYIKARGLSD